MDTLFTLHSHMRHLIFLLGAIAFVVSLIAFIRKTDITGITKVAIKTYVWVLTLQVLVGIIQLIVRWDTYGEGLRHRLEHAFIMLIVLGIAHMSGKFMRRPSPIGPRNTMFMMAATIILIVLGIMLLPTGPALLGMG